MKVAFIFSTAIATPSNGVKSQAITWKLMLEAEDHEVVLVNPWEVYTWKDFDAIIFFNFSRYMADFIKVIHKANKNIFIAPILDPYFSKRMFKLRLCIAIPQLRLSSNYSSLYEVRNLVKGFLVRSHFEKEYISNGLRVDESKIKLIPLSYGKEPVLSEKRRENFCLHVSLLADSRKNVKRLVDASIKYGFNLKLGGKLRDTSEENLLHSWIDGHSNIEYLGYLSDEQLEDLYCSARVFALPSVFEGVGLVALEAAVRGCDIVITNQGGPKEYYKGLAKTVNPFDIDEIGKAVMGFLNGDTFQPLLRNMLKAENNNKKLSSLLSNSIK
ncbi:MAG: glycosyltransferase [Prevotella sp.]|nr:glycosyltransferase [Prevotella sp.]